MRRLLGPCGAGALAPAVRADLGIRDMEKPPRSPIGKILARMQASRDHSVA